jgi:hypothetical protein
MSAQITNDAIRDIARKASALRPNVSVHGRTEESIFSRPGDDAWFDFNMATIKNLFSLCLARLMQRVDKAEKGAGNVKERKKR